MERQIGRLFEVLHGGDDRKGLVWAVDDMARTVRRHSRDLYGDNGQPGGIVAAVARHSEAEKELRSGYAWIVRLLVTQLLGLVGILGWWVFTSVAGG